MLLRIIDKPAENEHSEDALLIILDDSNETYSFTTEAYYSPITNNFHIDLNRYFENYVADGKPDDSGIGEKLIALGRNMGDKLLGENHELIKLKDDIEEYGYENLCVQIESKRVDFFEDLWEIIIFHDSKYILSSVVKSYVRKLILTDFENNYTDVNFQLNITASIKDKINKIFHDDRNISSSELVNGNKPLNVLYLISRPEDFDYIFTSSDIINLNLDAVSAGGAINYDIHQSTDLDLLQKTLDDTDFPIHIFHYDGPVVICNDLASFAIRSSSGKSSLLSVDKLCEILVTNQVSTLIINPSIYLRDGNPISPSLGLSLVVRSAHQQGLGNIIGLSHITDPWTSRKCFEAIYSQIAKGLSLGQAVVEARKYLQAGTNISLTTMADMPFHSWPLLVHYGYQSVTFFKSNQNLNETNSSQIQESFHSMLFGFKSEMLPPLLSQVGCGQVLKLIDQLDIARRAKMSSSILISGVDGVGKTQLAHVACLYLIQNKKIDFGFYFDFLSDDYSPDNILEMIAPILDVDVNHKEKVNEKLKKLNCCFVLDGISPKDNVQTKAQVTNNLGKSLPQFLNSLMSDGHIVIIIGEPHLELFKSISIKIEVAPLDLIEQKILASNSMKQLNLSGKLPDEIDRTKERDSILLCLKGHPWLIKKVMPIFTLSMAEELKDKIDQHINAANQTSKIECFYNWQWSTLAPTWKKILILCGEVRGLMLEMLMIAADQKETFEPAELFFNSLGDKNAKFSDGLDAWELAGFLKRFPHGRMIDSRCLDFLAARRGEMDFGIAEKEKFYFSQLICEGIRLLSQHILRQPNHNMLNNLLINRRYWVEHFERLWFNHDYRGFIACKNSFDQLLLQAKLINESKTWSLSLLEKSEKVISNAENSIEGKLAWLVIASGTLDQEEARNSHCIRKGVETYRAWFDSITGSPREEELALFQQVVVFLDGFYQNISNWKACIAVSQKALSVYTVHEAWKRMIQSLKSLSRYYFEIGDSEGARSFEHRILNDIPYNDAPPQFQTQQMLDILVTRVARSDTQHAKVLLEQLRASEGVDGFSEMLDSIECDLHYQEGNYVAALPYYCKVWLLALQSNQPAQVEKTKLRLQELEKKIGYEDFNKLFEKEVPLGTIKPNDYVSTLH